MNRFSSNELEKRVDEVLFYFWDPIGVNDVIAARAEYRSYVSAVLGHVEQDSKEELALFLDSLVTSNMGFSPEEGLSLKAAELLLEHKRCIEQGLA